MHAIDLLPLHSAGVTVAEGEIWAPAPDAPWYLVSTEGRAFRLPRNVVQPTRHGGMCERHLQSHIVEVFGDNPRLISADLGTHYARVDLARQILAAFVRPPRGREVAVRRNGVRWDCRLANLVWSGDRHADLLARFLAGDNGCHDAVDLEHAAIRLGVHRSVLGRVLTNERRCLGVVARSGPKSPAVIAAEIREAQTDARPEPFRAGGVVGRRLHTSSAAASDPVVLA